MTLFRYKIDLRVVPNMLLNECSGTFHELHEFFIRILFIRIARLKFAKIRIFEESIAYAQFETYLKALICEDMG